MFCRGNQDVLQDQPEPLQAKGDRGGEGHRPEELHARARVLRLLQAAVALAVPRAQSGQETVEGFCPAASVIHAWKKGDAAAGMTRFRLSWTIFRNC